MEKHELCYSMQISYSKSLQGLLFFLHSGWVQPAKHKIAPLAPATLALLQESFPPPSVNSVYFHPSGLIMFYFLSSKQPYSFIPTIFEPLCYQLT